ncbi:hypothetical protein [Pilimelia columellifera]|uniref:DUF4352 domain-containing protein n=1 Tax=Pilimelia columellifera subsp. columellifera TaxID=706583 RepID=A0ABN3N8P9_9ACTN
MRRHDRPPYPARVVAARAGSATGPTRRGSGAGEVTRIRSAGQPDRLDRRLVTGVVLALFGAWLLIGSASPRSAPPAPAGPVSATGGIRIDRVAGVRRPQTATAATGRAPLRRVSITVTLGAGPLDPMSYAAEDFGLRVAGERLTPYRVDVPGRRLPPGSRLTGEVVFDVPRSARSAELTLDGVAVGQVTLPAAGD